MKLKQIRNTTRFPDNSPPVVAFFYKHRTDILVLAFFILCILPVFSAWYYGDDAVNRDIRAFMKVENKNIFQYISDRLHYYLVTLGRLIPVSNIQTSFTFYIVNGITAYRLYNAVMNFLAVFCFASMVKAYSGSRKLFYIVMILYPGVFMFLTRYDDSITSYFMLMQTLVIYLSLSLILLKKFMDSRKILYLVFSVFIYLLSLLTYELSYPLFLVYLLAIFYYQQAPLRERLKKALAGSLPYLIPMLMCFALYIWVSANSVSAYEGVSLNLDIRKTAVTFLKQTIAAFPVVPHSYLIFNLDWGFIFKLKQTVANISMTDIISVVVFTYLLIKLNRLKDANPPERNRFLIWLSALLVVCPGLITSVSKKYQDALVWGLGYLTIYMMRFGLLLLGYFLYDSIFKRIKKTSLKRLVQTVSLVLLIAVHLFCQQGNRDVLSRKNTNQAVRHTAEMSIKSGVLEDMSDGSLLLLADMWYRDYNPENRTSLFRTLCGTEIYTDTITQLIKKSYETTGKAVTYNYNDVPFDVYYFEFDCPVSNAGYAFSSKLETLSTDETKVNNLLGSKVKIFCPNNEYNSVLASVKEGETFVIREFQLFPDGSGSLTAEIHALVDLQSIEFK